MAELFYFCLYLRPSQREPASKIENIEKHGHEFEEMRDGDFLLRYYFSSFCSSEQENFDQRGATLASISS